MIKTMTVIMKKYSSKEVDEEIYNILIYFID